MAGITLSLPQWASTSVSTGSASQPSIFREAMATCSCTSRDGSRASVATCSRIAGVDFAEVSRGADGPGAKCRIVVGEEPLVKRGFQRTAADEHPERVQSGFSVRSLTLQFSSLRRSSSRRLHDRHWSRRSACAPDNRSVRIRWADSRKKMLPLASLAIN